MKSFKFFQKKPPTVWRKSNGAEVEIKDLTTRHIQNIQCCLIGTGHTTIPNPYEGLTNREWIMVFQNELNRRREEV
jgi:hypothetical protein